jgi:hypothetical protein
MIKQTPEPSLLSLDFMGGRVRVGFLIPALLILSLLFIGCQGKDDVTPPSLPANVINVSLSKTLSISPATAASGDLIYVAWTDQDSNQGFDIFLAQSTNGGITFSSPENISQSIATSGNPRIALSGKTLYIVWEEFIAEKNESDILFRKREVQGDAVTWTPPLNEPGTNLSASSKPCKDDSKPTTPAPCPSQFPDIAVEENRVFVVWAEENHYTITLIAQGQAATDFKITNSDIQMTTSQDGIHFTAPFNVTGPKGTICGPGTTETASLNPSLAAADGNLSLSWEDCTKPNAKILFRKFSQSSVSSPSQEATVISDPFKNASRPSLAAEGDAVYAAWEEFSIENSPAGDCTRTNIFFTASLQQGSDFSSPSKPAVTNLSNNACGAGSNSVKLTTSGSSVYVAWEGNTPGAAGIPLKRSGDRGSTFGATENLSQTGGSSANPALAAFGGMLYAFWEDSTLGNLEVVFARR